MSYSTLTTELDAGVLVVTLSREDRLNAFTLAMARRARTSVSIGRRRRRGARAAIVAGAGRAFSVGMELAADTKANPFGLNQTLSPTLDDMRTRLDDPAIRSGVCDGGGRVTLAIYDCLKPVIGAINGVAAGVGATMTLAMDFRLAVRFARFGFVFAKLGLVPEACSSWFLPRLVGEQTALDWTLTAELIDADAARAAGLLRSIHEDRDALLAEAKALAHRIVDGRSPVAIALTRATMKRNPALTGPLDAHRIDSVAVFHTSIADGKEGVAAFREKRPAEFTSKASAMPDFYPWF